MRDEVKANVRGRRALCLSFSSLSPLSLSHLVSNDAGVRVQRVLVQVDLR